MVVLESLLCLFKAHPTHKHERLSWTSTLLAVGITPTTTAGFSKWSPRFTDGIYREAGLFLTTPFTKGCDGVNNQTLPPGRSHMLYF